MNLHDNTKLFEQAVRATADQKNIPAIYVEKDYWVTYALHKIFTSAIGPETIFKGGTSLLKCFQKIERFSEDIDLVVLRREGETDSKLKGKLKTIGKVISDELPEVEIEGITHKMGMNRKTAHSYTKLFTGHYGQVRDVIILEATWLGYYEPYTTRQINSFIYDMMVNAGQNELAEQHGLMPFAVQVLEPRRTICEKIMSLVRFSYGENPIEDLKKKIRHTYDLNQLLKDEENKAFFESKEFDEMLLKVAKDDVVSFRNNNQWLRNHPNDALLFEHIELVWEELKGVYKGDFKALVFGSSFPDEKEILETLKAIRNRMTDIEWGIEIP